MTRARHCGNALVLLAASACRPAAPSQPPEPTPAPAPAPIADETPPEFTPPEPTPDDLAGALQPIVDRMQVPGLGAAVVTRDGVVALGVAGRYGRPEGPAPGR